MLLSKNTKLNKIDENCVQIEKKNIRTKLKILTKIRDQININI